MDTRKTFSDWAALVPELTISHLQTTLDFYVSIIGFSVRFKRPEDGFAYLEYEACQIMVEELGDDSGSGWLTGKLEKPYGRGINFQLDISDVQSVHRRVSAADWPLFSPLKTSWYREGALENGQTEFLVQDPDGYLLRFMQHIGSRRVGDADEGDL